MRTLRISPFSLKKGTCQAPRNFDLDYRLLDTVNLLLLSLHMYLMVNQGAFAVLTSWLPHNRKINCVTSFSGKQEKKTARAEALCPSFVSGEDYLSNLSRKIDVPACACSVLTELTRS